MPFWTSSGVLELRDYVLRLVSDEGRASFFFTGGSASSAGVEFLRVRRKGISGDTSVMVNHRSWTQRGGIDELLLPETTPPLGAWCLAAEY